MGHNADPMRLFFVYNLGPEKSKILSFGVALTDEAKQQRALSTIYLNQTFFRSLKVV